MVSSMNVVLTVLFIIHFMIKVDSYVPDEAQIICTDNIFNEYGYDRETTKRNLRTLFPKMSFVHKTFDTLENRDAKNYFRYLHNIVIHKEGTELPKEFCRRQVSVLMPREIRVGEESKCNKEIKSMYLKSDNITLIIKDAFWKKAETDVTSLIPLDYRNKYFYYLSEQLDFPPPKLRIPMTPFEYCFSNHSERKRHEPDTSVEQSLKSSKISRIGSTSNQE